MAKDVTFQLDPKGGAEVLQQMMMPTIRRAGEQIASRAESMAGSVSTNPPKISVSTAVGRIKRGERAIATIRADGLNAHSNYIGHMVLVKSKDAGRS